MVIDGSICWTDSDTVCYQDHELVLANFRSLVHIVAQEAAGQGDQGTELSQVKLYRVAAPHRHTRRRGFHQGRILRISRPQCDNESAV